jgi:hypothetical protein
MQTLRRQFSILLATAIFWLYAPTTRAQDYEPLVGVPLLNRDATSFQDYIDILLTAAIGIAALMVVLRIIWAGVQYMLSEVVTSKEEAKRSIGGALLGLLIILASVVILTTINPNLARLDVLQSAPTVRGGGGSLQPVTTDTTGYSAAQAEADACEARGGNAQIRKEGSGNFVVDCAGGNTTPTTAQAQLSGWPQTFTGPSAPMDAGQAGVECQASGGVPESRQITFNEYVANCYSAN